MPDDTNVSGSERIVLVQCTDSKRDVAARARDLYDVSRYFRKQRAYAESVTDNWFIQSAKYGVIDPDAVIEPYDLRADEIDEPEEWAGMIAARIGANFSTDSVVEILGGSDYADPLTPLLEEMGFEVHEPLRGLRIGEREAKLEEAVA